MITAVASGKGGTGKTTVAVNLALCLGEIQLLDCDVEEPNAHLFLNPVIEEKKPVEVLIPLINEELCVRCGKCAEFCQYNALAVTKELVMFFPELCHSCGGCAIVCPNNAISEGKRTTGVVEVGGKDKIRFVHGILEVGEAMASPVISEVKKQINKDVDAILDVPPGTSCAVIESVRDSDYCILVTEPTPFGLNDLKLAVNMLREMKIPHGVIVNRAGIGDGRVQEYCDKEGIRLLMEIPHDEQIAALYSNGIAFVERMPEYEKKFRQVYEVIKKEVG
ncbi:MAG: (4Fe-4S)-binding protein [Candidatus Altiarchaeales archaeon ex4484_96]|nr:MAG: (4Fe-4S)-binding protein [Candidatus Altiarchaeales archaeon ex4484_96]